MLVYEKVYKVLKENPDGLTIREIKEKAKIKCYSSLKTMLQKIKSRIYPDGKRDCTVSNRWMTVYKYKF